MPKEYVISDLHFNHKNILDYERNEFNDINDKFFLILLINEDIFSF